MEWKIDVVIHDEYGGFSLTPEMVRRLKKRGCTWANKCGHDDRKTQYWLPYRDEISDEAENLRKDPDLVAVVRELTEEYERIVDKDDAQDIMSWRERTDLRSTMLANLRVVEVTVVIEIDDFDGKESVRVTGGAW